MNVVFTRINTSYACRELADALAHVIPGVTNVAMEFAARADKRKLVVVCLCPCCASDPLLREQDAVFVTPFCGVSPNGLELERVAKYPPYRTPGEGNEARTVEEFLQEFRKTIERALAT